MRNYTPRRCKYKFTYGNVTDAWFHFFRESGDCLVVLLEDDETGEFHEWLYGTSSMKLWFKDPPIPDNQGMKRTGDTPEDE